MHENFPMDLATAQVEERLQMPLSHLFPICAGLEAFRREAGGRVTAVTMELTVGTDDDVRTIKVTKSAPGAQWLLEF